MALKNKIAREWISYWNDRNIEGCAVLLHENVELRSTNAMRLFPDSGGVIKGKSTALKYFQIVFEKFHDVKLTEKEFRDNDDSVIVNASNGNGINSYVQYFVNTDGQIYLMKADVFEK